MKEIIPLLNELAEKLGVTVEYIFNVFVRQAFYSGITDILQYVILAFASSVWWGFRKKLQKEWVNCESMQLCWMFFGIVFGFMIIVFFVSFPKTIRAFINPEYWALEEIFKTLKR